MKDVKITKDCFLPKENVKFYIAYTSQTVKNDVCKLRKEGKVYDYTSGKKILTVVYLKTGEAILTNLSLETLNKRMNESEG